ncbi:MAG: REP-associated tyrosine transposase [Candidatus Promineifilaceae bacterium]
MSHLDYKYFYKRNLPHLQPNGAILFVTFRLYGSLPQKKLIEYAQEKARLEQSLLAISALSQRRKTQYIEQKRLFARWDTWLDAGLTDACWLRNPRIAQEIVNCIVYRDNIVYELHAYCVMANHVHIVFRPLKQDTGADIGLSQIMQSLKGYSAKQANTILGRKGTFWQSESYDHVIRNEQEWHRVMSYVLHNPVKAGLVDDWAEWPWSYCKYVERTV